jgi:hypothetical protein
MKLLLKMEIYENIKPRRGEIDATPSGLGNGLFIPLYNPNTPSGLGNGLFITLYNSNTPLGLKQ